MSADGHGRGKPFVAPQCHSPNAAVFPWDMDTPTKTGATDILYQLVGDALEQSPNACRQSLDADWLPDGTDFLAGVDELLASGDATASPPAIPDTPPQTGKRTRTKTPEQLQVQAKQQKGRRVKMKTALDDAVSQVATLQGLLRDCEAALRCSEARSVEREALLAKTEALRHWPKRNVALGMHETAVSCCDSEFLAKHFENMSYCINHVLADDSKGFFERGEFEPTRDACNLRGVNRFIWKCIDYSAYHTDPRCALYWEAIRYLQFQLPGHQLRDQKYAARCRTCDQYILDSGDYTKCFSSCTSEKVSHMDHDGGRGNSISVCIPCDDDAIKIIKNSTGEEHVMYIKRGHIAMWNSAVYHLGAGHQDFNNRDLSKFRRRLFLYFDDRRYLKSDGSILHPKDDDGAQLHADQLPIPSDYRCNIWENLCSLSAAYNALSSRHLEGRIIVTERTLTTTTTNAGEVNTLPA